MNYGDIRSEGAGIKFIPEYPFSLDPGENNEIIIKELPIGKSVIQGFKVRVDAGAREGENNIAFAYKDCLGCEWKEQSFPVTVLEAQTMFDIVLQEISSEGVFFAIANIGKNPANAVTVRIPEQENFGTKLISASIVGNLESGDYTMVGFQIIPKQSKIPGEEKIRSLEEKTLTIQIDYTDPLGERRTVQETIMLNPSTLIMNEGITAMGMRGKKQSFFSGFWFWVVLIAVIVFTGKKLHKKYRRKLRLKF